MCSLTSMLKPPAKTNQTDPTFMVFGANWILPATIVGEIKWKWELRLTVPGAAAVSLQTFCVEFSTRFCPAHGTRGDLPAPLSRIVSNQLGRQPCTQQTWTSRRLHKKHQDRARAKRNNPLRGSVDLSQQQLGTYIRWWISKWSLVSFKELCVIQTAHLDSRTKEEHLSFYFYSWDCT